MVGRWMCIDLYGDTGHIADTSLDSFIAVSPGQELSSEVIPRSAHIRSILDDRHQTLVTRDHWPAVELDSLPPHNIGLHYRGGGSLEGGLGDTPLKENHVTNIFYPFLAYLEYEGWTGICIL